MTVAATAIGTVTMLNPGLPQSKWSFMPSLKLYCYGTATGDASAGHIAITHRWQASTFELERYYIVITEILYSSDQASDDRAYSKIAGTALQEAYNSSSYSLHQSVIDSHNGYGFMMSRMERPISIGVPYTRTTNWDIVHTFETNTNTKLYYVVTKGYGFLAEPNPFLNM